MALDNRLSAVIVGKMLAYMGVVFPQVIVLFSVGTALFQMPWASRRLPCFCWLWAAASFPSSAEGFIGTLSRLTPSAWGIEGYMGLVADNWTLADAAPDILALLGFAVVFASIATWRFKFE